VRLRPYAFDLLQVTANNPVVLAHAQVPAGVYKQIRLVLAPGATVTLADGTTEPLTTPSAETGGIKINGVFDVPAGRLYTLDIDMDPGRSIHHATGFGYVLKPVLALTGSDVTSGNFFYSGNFGGEPFIVALGPDGTLATITAQYPRYVVEGTYVHDGTKQTLTITPREVTCPDCSVWERLRTSALVDVPAAHTYDVMSFGADFLDLRDADGATFHLFRVPTFSLEGEYSQKTFTVQVAVPDASWQGKTIVAQIVPEEDGRPYSALATIPASLTPAFDFAVPRSAFTGPVKNYVLLMAIVPTPGDVDLRSDGTIADIRNIVADNSKGVVQLRVGRDTMPTAPVTVPFGLALPTTPMTPEILP
jgi:hypothetical protein